MLIALPMYANLGNPLMSFNTCTQSANAHNLNKIRAAISKGCLTPSSLLRCDKLKFYRFRSVEIIRQVTIYNNRCKIYKNGDPHF